MNVVFMGTPDYAKEILKSLIEDKEIKISLVLTQPDRPVGRKKILTAPPVKELSIDNSIEVIQPISLRDKEIEEKIKSLKPDFIVVAAYGQLLPKNILDIAPCINLHASILPQYRGASPIQQGLINADEYLGVTAMLMDEGLDSGDILGFRYIKRIEANRLDIAMDKLSKEAAKLTISILKNYDKLNPIPQNNLVSSKCPKIKKEDGLIKLNSADEVYRKYCAFYGWPGVYLENGLKLLDIDLIETNSKNKEGEILEIIKNGVKVGCKRGSIVIKELQPKSKSKMLAKAYLAGQRRSVGDNIL